MRVNVHQYEVLRALEKLGVIRITYTDNVFNVEGTAMIEIEVEEGVKL